MGLKQVSFSFVKLTYFSLNFLNLIKRKSLAAKGEMIAAPRMTFGEGGSGLEGLIYSF